MFEEVCLFSKKSSKDVILFYKKFQRLGLHASYFIKNAKVNYEKKMDKIYLFIKQVVMVEMRRIYQRKTMIYLIYRFLENVILILVVIFIILLLM